MDYNNSFAKELDRLAKSKDICDLPQNVYDLIKAKIVSDADSKCNSCMSEMKKMVSRGEYKYVNGKRVVSHTSGLAWRIEIHSNIRLYHTTGFLEKYLSDDVNANALQANCIRRKYDDGFVQYYVELFKTAYNHREQENFFGFKDFWSFDIQKAPFADLYLNALRDSLKRNGIGYRMTLEFHQIQNPSNNKTVVKKYDITDNFPHVQESFETPRANRRSTLDSFSYQILLETTISF